MSSDKFLDLVNVRRNSEVFLISTVERFLIIKSVGAHATYIISRRVVSA